MSVNLYLIIKLKPGETLLITTYIYSLFIDMTLLRKDEFIKIHNDKNINS